MPFSLGWGGAPLGGRALEYGIPKTTLHDHFRGMSSRQKAYGSCQALRSNVENALLQWAAELDDQGFPPGPDLW